MPSPSRFTSGSRWAIRSATARALAQASPAEIEAHLAALRHAGVAVDDLEIRTADLADVVIQLMNAPAIATPLPTTTAGALS